MSSASTHDAVVSSRANYALRLPHGGALQLGGERRPLVMGILNVTADSFSDGGLFLDAEAAAAHAERMAGEGADIIDVGGESTRPGAEAVSPDEQIARVIPVIERLAARLDTPISIDTASSEVARRALDSGAQVLNDVTALRGDERMGALAAETGAPVILMHMLGAPKTMQESPAYGDVVEDIIAFLRERIAYAAGCGVAREQIVVDPGFGFGKTLDHNLELLRRLDEFGTLDRPVLAGTSRKSMIGRILDLPADQRLYGSLAAVAAAVERGAAIVRVHDVKPALEVI